jgi:hypothetical protein
MNDTYIVNPSSYHFYYSFKVDKNINILKTYIHCGYITARYINMQCNIVMLKTVNNKNNISSPKEFTAPCKALMNALKMFTISRKALREVRIAPRESLNITRESPNVPRESPNVPRESPNVPRESPNVPRESPNVSRESPNVSRGVKNKLWILTNSANNGKEPSFSFTPDNALEKE